MPNPSLPVTRVNRVAPPPGLEKVQLDGGLTFAGAGDRAAFAAELAAGEAATLVQVSNAAARKSADTYEDLGLTPYVGMKVLEAGIREVTQITCLGSAAGVAEVTDITCLGSTYAAAVAEVAEITAVADVAGSLNNTAFYLPLPNFTYPYVWFNVNAAGVDPGIGDYGIEVAIALFASAATVAAAVQAAVDADANFVATVLGAVVTVTWTTAGATDDAQDNDSGFGFLTTTAGSDTTHTLEGLTVTLYAPGATLTVGYSLAGNVGTIPVMLPASTRTAAQIAGLTQASVDAHALLLATVLDDVVTVTNVTQGAVTNASAGATGFTINVTTNGVNHTLEGKTLTLKALNLTVTVGYSLAGTVGDIPVTLPATTRTAAQIASLTQAAVEAHASFGAAVLNEVVTVTNTLAAAVSGAGAGTTGFNLVVLTEGIDATGNLFVLLATADLASDAGWLCLPSIDNVIGPAFAAYYDGANFAIGYQVATKVIPTVEVYDTHGCFDLGTGRFTPTKAGKYLFTVKGRVQMSTGYMFVSVFKNGAEVSARAGSEFLNNSGNVFGSLAANSAGGIVILEANGTTDYFEYFVRQDSVDFSSRNFRGVGAAENIFQALFLQS